MRADLDPGSRSFELPTCTGRIRHGTRTRARVNRVDIALLKGIDRSRDLLLANTERFASGLPANNALLWGARGMGKSSLVKAVHAGVNAGLAKAGCSAFRSIARTSRACPAL